MKKLLLLFSFLILSSPIFAQSLNIGYSPLSIDGWGKIPEVSSTHISYDHDVYDITNDISIGVSVRFIHLKLNQSYRHNSSNSIIWDGNYVSGFFNTYFKYTIHNSISIYGSAGVGKFSKTFPNSLGTTTNFLLFSRVMKHFDAVSIGVEYNHISNAFIGKINPGVDNLAFTLSFNL